MNIPRLVLAATHSGAGKTSVCAALMAAFSRRGLAVRPYKTGPDYIDPSFHSRITGQPSINLDSWLLPAPVLYGLFTRRAAGPGAFPPKGPTAPAKGSAAPAQELALVEGVMGMFDGRGTGHEGSTAHVAELLRAPVVLVINGRGISRSAAALVSGYARFHPSAPVSGVIVNRAGERLYALLKNIIEDQTGVPCFGHLPEDSAFALPGRHLGLVPADEVERFDAVVEKLAQAAERHLDLPGLLDLARAAPKLAAGKAYTYERGALEETTALRPPLRIGVARDAAFSFYYQDNLDLLRELGAELVFFSPLRDAALPPGLHGLYLGGGFPEVHAAVLEANGSFRKDIKTALENGLPAYAECGGLVYLCAALENPSPDSGAVEAAASVTAKGGKGGCVPGGTFSLAGFFPYTARMGTKLRRFGYAEVELTRDTVLGPAGTAFRAHEFHYSFLELPEKEPLACLVRKPGREHGADAWRDGLVKKRVYAAYAHLHFYSNPATARNFLLACREFRNAAGEATPGRRPVDSLPQAQK